MLKLLKKVMVMAVFFLSTTLPAHAYKAVIFDCDGVLVNTEYLKYLAWKKALANIDVDFKESEYFALVGESSIKIAKEIKKRKKCQFDEKDLIAHKNDIYVELHKQGVPSFKGAVKFLNELIANKNQLGIKLGIASSAPKAEILENLKQIGISPEHFEAILSGSDDLQHINDPEGTNKPKPYIYQLAAKKLQVSPQECLVFEDSNPGVIAAAKAGMTVVAIPNFYTAKHDFSSADRKISRFRQIDIRTLSNLKSIADFQRK